MVLSSEVRAQSSEATQTESGEGVQFEDVASASTDAAQAADVEPVAATAEVLPPIDQQAELLLSVGVGTGLRLVTNFDVRPDCRVGENGLADRCLFSPWALSLRGGFLLGAKAGEIQHGASLTFNAALTSDGTASFGFDPFGQTVLTPSYLAKYRFNEWLHFIGQFGVPLVLGPRFAWGLDVSVAPTVMFTHGLGAFFQVGVATYFGGNDSVWPILAFELGAVFNWELLP